MRTEVIATTASLQAIEAAWWNLFARVPSATPFASPAWLIPWWTTFSPGELFTVALWSDDRLIGLAPLYIEDGSLGRRLLPLGLGVTDLLDLLVDPLHTTEVGFAMGDVLKANEARYAVWSAEEAPPNASVLSIPDPEGWRSEVARQSACPVLALSADDNGCGAIPSRKRRKWQMAKNRVARRSSTTTQASAATLRDDLDDLFRLHGARWQSRGETGVLVDPSARRFHEAATPALLAAGLLRLTTLRIGDKVAGVYYGLRRGANAYAYLGGFDPAFSFESPGTLLLGSAIEAAREEGASALNFLRGPEPYKYEWGAIDQWNQRRLFRRSS